jgi:hypothetical protein
MLWDARLLSITGVDRGAQRVVSGERPTAHRPDVEQQKHAGECDKRLLRAQTAEKKENGKNQSPWLSSLGVCDVGIKRSQAKKHAEHIFPLGDPGDRLYVQRMDRKKSGDGRAGQHLPRHPGESRKHEQHVGRVQQHVGEVIAARPQTIDRRVQHQRDPGQRKPVPVMERRERPT